MRSCWGGSEFKTSHRTLSPTRTHARARTQTPPNTTHPHTRTYITLRHEEEAAKFHAEAQEALAKEMKEKMLEATKIYEAELSAKHAEILAHKDGGLIS